MWRAVCFLILGLSGCGGGGSDSPVSTEEKPQTQGVRFQVPEGFERLPFSTYTIDSQGRASVALDLNQLWNSSEECPTGEYFVDWDEGNDSNPGTSDKPLKTIKAAAQRQDAGTIWLAPGIHYDGLDGYEPQQNIAIRASSTEKTIIRMGEDPSEYSFDPVPGLESTFSTTIYRRVSKVLSDDYRTMSRAADSQTVGEAPGSWYYDTQTKELFVRTFDDAPPSSNLVLLTTSVNSISGDRALLIEGVQLEGGNHGFQANSDGGVAPRLYIQNSVILHAINFGIDSNGAETYLKNVELGHSGLDNLNYHSSGLIQPLAIEINVSSGNAGNKELDANKNASSMHDSGVVARINGDYFRSYGPNIPDTGGSYSLNVGVTVRESLAPSSGKNVNFWAGSGGNGPAKMYCHLCISKGSLGDFYAVAATIFLSNPEDNWNLNFAIDGLSSVEEYQPVQVQ
jgi:hypothetical protein